MPAPGKSTDAHPKTWEFPKSGKNTSAGGILAFSWPVLGPRFGLPLAAVNVTTALPGLFGGPQTRFSGVFAADRPVSRAIHGPPPPKAVLEPSVYAGLTFARGAKTREKKQAAGLATRRLRVRGGSLENYLLRLRRPKKPSPSSPNTARAKVEGSGMTAAP